MISAADFADVFPWMAESKFGQQRVAQTDFRAHNGEAEDEYDECIARWEDDGGRIAMNFWSAFVGRYSES